MSTWRVECGLAFGSSSSSSSSWQLRAASSCATSHRSPRRFSLSSSPSSSSMRPFPSSSKYILQKSEKHNSFFFNGVASKPSIQTFKLQWNTFLLISRYLESTLSCQNTRPRLLGRTPKTSLTSPTPPFCLWSSWWARSSSRSSSENSETAVFWVARYQAHFVLEWLCILCWHYEEGASSCLRCEW